MIKNKKKIILVLSIISLIVNVNFVKASNATGHVEQK